MPVRLDKWLQIARVFKTRTQATNACTAGRVRVNEQVVKPHRKLALDDRVEVERGDWIRILIVKELREKTLPKAEVPRIFEDLSPERPRLDPIQKILRRAPVSREKGMGRPTKKQRRELDRLRSE